MWTRATATKMGLVLLGALLVAGFFGVLEKRFSEGGIYPYYASFRSDPLGTSVFYESIDRIEAFAVSRNLTDLNSIQGLDEDTVILLLGFPRDGFEEIRAPDSSPVMKAVEAGARLVITMNPELVPEKFQPGVSDLEDDWIERRRRIREERAARRVSSPHSEAEKEEAPKKAEDTSKSASPDDVAEAGEKDVREEAAEEADKAEEAEFEKQMEEVLGPPLTKKLGFAIPSSDSFDRPAEGWETRAGESAATGKVPSELPQWRSQYRFETKDPAWKGVVWVGEDPVVIERPFGKGSVVLASDSYFASNESLHLGAEPEFLLWLIGGKSKVVFDETIHGTVETGGAMKLIRRYRAHGIFFGLIAFLGLWAWRSAVPLVPGSEAQERGLVGEGGEVMGEGTGSGLIRLLRRSVPSTSLLSQCVEVWTQSRAAGAATPGREKIDQVLARHRREPKQFGIVEAYRGIVELLRKR